HAIPDLSTPRIGIPQHLWRHARSPGDPLLDAGPKLRPQPADPGPNACPHLSGLNGAKCLEPSHETSRAHLDFLTPAAQRFEPRHLRSQGLGDARFDKREGVAGNEQALGPWRRVAILEEGAADLLQDRRVACKPARNVEAWTKGNRTLERHPTPGGAH